MILTLQVQFYHISMLWLHYSTLFDGSMTMPISPPSWLNPIISVQLITIFLLFTSSAISN